MSDAQLNSANPPISSLLRGITWLEVLVLIVTGGGLLFLPDLAREQWPWAIAPFNGRFVGTVYLGSFVSAMLMAFHGRWSPGRIVLPMIFIFTTIVLGVSFLHLDQFDLQRWQPWIWFLLYIVLPINSAYHLWIYRDRQAVDSFSTPSHWRGSFLMLSVLFGVYGLALLFFPTASSAFWPWPIDGFHGQMYSVVFITPAVGLFLIANRASSWEWKTLGLTQLVIGACAIIGLLLVDAVVPPEKKVNWALAGTWLWLLIMAVYGGVGMSMLFRAGRNQEAG